MRQLRYSEVLRLRLDPVTRQEIADLAESERINMSELIRRELRKVARKHRTDTDRASRSLVMS